MLIFITLFWRFSSVEILIDFLRDGEKLDIELLFHFDKVIFIAISNEINCKTKMSKPARSADSMQVSFRIFREIKVDHNIDSLNIDTSRDEIRGY